MLVSILRKKNRKHNLYSSLLLRSHSAPCRDTVRVQLLDETPHQSSSNDVTALRTIGSCEGVPRLKNTNTSCRNGVLGLRNNISCNVPGIKNSSSDDVAPALKTSSPHDGVPNLRNSSSHDAGKEVGLPSDESTKTVAPMKVNVTRSTK